MNITISLDEPTAERFVEFANLHYGGVGSIASGLIRAALRAELKPEGSHVAPGRPQSTVSAFIKRRLVARPRTRAELIKSFTGSNVTEDVDRMLKQGDLQVDDKGRLHVSPKIIPLLPVQGPKLAPLSPFTPDADLVSLLEAAEDP